MGEKMSSLNQVTLIGRVGKDAEVRFMPNGTAAANFSMATSEEWKDKTTGEKQERVEWHSICVFGPLAEICGKYVQKGGKVSVIGKIQTRKWQDKEGIERFRTEIIADKVILLGGSNGKNTQQNSQQNNQQSSSASDYAKASQGGFTPNDDDIPF